MKRCISAIYFSIILMFVTTIFFGLLSNRSFAQQTVENKETEKKVDSGEIELTGWRIKDYQPYIQAMKDLEKLSVEYSEIILKLAIDEYSTGIDILEDMENEVIDLIEKNKKKKNLNERWFWQEIDRMNYEKRQLRRKKQEAKMKAVTFFVKSINHLDDLKSRAVKERPEFINFKTRLFQVYISCQYDLHNLQPCIPILERYISINNETRKDVWAYKYLSNCYAYMEASLNKYRNATEEMIMNYKQKKNRSLLQAAEIQYGVESVEYKHLQELISKDEKKSDRLNDFR